jgi:trans-aconitate methyltransferase
MDSVQVWKSELYDSKLSIVSDYGKDVVGLLAPKKGERILDLGCGTGDLAVEINKSGASVTGMDLSIAMIDQANKKYPDIKFITGDAADFAFDEPFDAVFSNAALHWVKQADKVIACVWNSLHAGGRFVVEFGGKGNVEKVIHAINEVLQEDYGIDGSQRNPWYFPSIAEYSSLLEKQGFHVRYAVHFDRPTQMEDGHIGLQHWLNSFADNFVKGFSIRQRNEVFEKVAAKAQKDLFYDDVWYVDYKRLRILAVKPKAEV